MRIMRATGRRPVPLDAPLGLPSSLRVAVPESSDLAPLSASWRTCFESTIEHLRAAGAEVSVISIRPFVDGGRLLYESALVAERYASVCAFVDAHPGDVDPIVRSIIAPAGRHSAAALLEARRLAGSYCARASSLLEGAHCLLLPTAPMHPTVADVLDDPVGLNRQLGTFVAFANLFDLAAVSVPGLGATDGFGATVYARPFADDLAIDVARLITGEQDGSVGEPRGGLLLLVLGAHMRGEPLNDELTGRGARFVADARTAARYRLYALPTQPPKPGLVESGPGGYSIEGELWELPPGALAEVLATLPEPMLLGAAELEGGERVTCFFCHGSATAGAREISEAGGWRRHLAATGARR
jgi:allophanate hydrolase